MRTEKNSSTDCKANEKITHAELVVQRKINNSVRLNRKVQFVFKLIIQGLYAKDNKEVIVA